MKKTMYTIAIFTVILIGYRCSSSKKTTATTTTPAATITNETILAQAQKKTPSVTLANITNGQSIYSNQCKQCHGEKGGIEGHSAAEWVNIIDRMAKKSSLSDAEKSDLSHFIFAKKELLTK